MGAACGNCLAIDVSEDLLCGFVGIDRDCPRSASEREADPNGHPVQVGSPVLRKPSHGAEVSFRIARRSILSEGPSMSSRSTLGLGNLVVESVLVPAEPHGFVDMFTHAGVSLSSGEAGVTVCMYTEFCSMRQ